MAATLLIMLCFFFSTVLIPNTRAKIIEFDGYWKERQAKAVEHINAAYHPRPEEVTHHFNQHVESYVAEMGYNNTRRVLKGRKARNKGPCEATNPIDKCWRCDPNWAKNRFRLADCAIGFGRGTTGGKGGPIYVVTDCSDDDVVYPKPGTLRHAVIQSGPLWIIFARSMVITLKQELIMTSNKTIDGRGANVHIAYGAQITIQFIHNVIIHNVHIHDIGEASGSMIRDSVTHFGQRGKSDGDGVSLFGASNIWLDHLSIYRCFDGLIDAIQTSTAVTVSNSHFTQHNEVMLFGAHDSYKDDQKMQITLAFNHFGKALVQRMPRVRWGFVHVVNNAYTHWLMYAIGGSSQPTIISQGNRYYAPINPASKQVTKREYATAAQWKNWAWISEGDVMLNGAFFLPSGNPAAAKKFSSEFMIKAYAGAMVPQLTRHAGTLNCLIGKPC